MLDAKEYWDILSELAEDSGLRLYDIERPGSRGGVLRVFISSRNSVDPTTGKKQGVGHEDCVRMTRAIENHDQYEDILPDGCELEVSSPGINRPLKRSEHFEGAIGERIKLRLSKSLETQESSSEESKKGKKLKGDPLNATGILLSFTEDYVEIDDELRKHKLKIERHFITEAYTDFKF